MPATFIRRLREAPAIAAKLIRSTGELLNVADTIAHATDDTGAVITLDKLHSVIDRGGLFSIQRKLTVNAGQSIYMSGLTDINDVHFIQQHFTADGGGLEIRLFEDSVISGGTPYTVQNRNRKLHGVIEPRFQILDAPTIVDIGTEIGLVWLPPSSVPVSGGSERGEQDEWVLDGGNRQYLLEMKNTNGVGGNRDLTTSMMFYEPAVLPFYGD